MMKLFFASQGFEVSLASDGLEALARIEEQVPDLVITDYWMPRMTGLQLCAYLRARAETRHVPIILHTAHPTPPPGTGLYERAILKPSPLDQLHAEVCALLTLPH